MIEFLIITLVISCAVISPGPDFAIVTRNSLRYSQKAGIMTSFSIACSTLGHASYCILGFAIIISKSLLLFNVIKYIGASYLIFLGIKGLFEKKAASKIAKEKIEHDISDFQAFFQGLCCNALNPKTIFFFLALFTMMIKPTTPMAMQIGYALEIASIHFVWFSAISVLFSHEKVKLFLDRFLSVVTKAFGGALIFFGVKVALLSQR